MPASLLSFSIIADKAIINNNSIQNRGANYLENSSFCSEIYFNNTPIENSVMLLIVFEKMSKQEVHCDTCNISARYVFTKFLNPISDRIINDRLLEFVNKSITIMIDFWSLRTLI